MEELREILWESEIAGFRVVCRRREKPAAKRQAEDRQRVKKLLEILERLPQKGEAP